MRSLLLACALTVSGATLANDTADTKHCSVYQPSALRALSDAELDAKYWESLNKSVDILLTQTDPAVEVDICNAQAHSIEDVMKARQASVQRTTP